MTKAALAMIRPTCCRPRPLSAEHLSFFLRVPRNVMMFSTKWMFTLSNKVCWKPRNFSLTDLKLVFLLNMASLVARGLGEVAEADHWLAGQFIPWPCRRPLFTAKSLDLQKLGEETAVTYGCFSCHGEHQRMLRDPSDRPRCKNRNKCRANRQDLGVDTRLF